MKHLYVLSFLLVCIFQVVSYSQIQEQNCGSAKSVNAVHFVNADLGWAVGSNGTVLKTMDGDENWQTMILEESHLYFDVFFTNEHTGWIVGNSEIYKTTDGGDNWEPMYTLGGIGAGAWGKYSSSMHRMHGLLPTKASMPIRPRC